MQTIRLAPLTLVYGQNSAGKSSLLEAIKLLVSNHDNLATAPGYAKRTGESFLNKNSHMFEITGEWIAESSLRLNRRYERLNKNHLSPRYCWDRLFYEDEIEVYEQSRDRDNIAKPSP